MVLCSVFVCLSISCMFICQSYVRPSIFSFPDGNFSKYKWMFTKLGMYTVIVEIWFGIANEQIL